MILFLDACALIYWQEVKEPFYSQFAATLSKIYQQHPAAKIAVSRLSELECLVKTYKDNNSGLVGSYQEFFNADGLIIVEFGSTRTIPRWEPEARKRADVALQQGRLAVSAISFGDRHARHQGAGYYGTPACGLAT